MMLVPREDLREIVKLARAAVKLHDMQTHYGKCDVCEIADKWRRALRDETLDVNGIGEWREARKR